MCPPLTDWLYLWAKTLGPGVCVCAYPVSCVLFSKFITQLLLMELKKMRTPAPSQHYLPRTPRHRLAQHSIE